MNSEERNSMRKFTRLALAVSAAVTALAFTGSAWAVYQPRLIVTAVTNGANKPTTMLFEQLQTANDDPTLKDTVYAPPGYQATLTQAPGTNLGTVEGTVILRGAGNAMAAVTGRVVADSPANWAPQATRCTQTVTHEAVWRLDITIAGTALQIPIFVDHSTGADAAFSSVKIQLCLPSPTDPVIPGGAQLLDAFFDVQKVFTSPANTADRVWRAVMVPYVPGTTTPNPAMIVESQSVVPGRVSFSLKSKSLKRGFVQISGKVLVNGRPNARARVLLYNIRNLNKAIASTRTKRNGTFVLRKKFKKKTVLVGLAINAEDLGACPLPALPPPPGFPPNQGCKTATRSFGASAVVTARPKKR
jgi:hypothetical protein